MTKEAAAAPLAAASSPAHPSLQGFVYRKERMRRPLCAARQMLYIDSMAFLNLRDKNLDGGTQAAEGMRRRRFTVAELEAMVAAGILGEDERIELIGGEVVPMSPKGNRHEILKAALTLYWAKRLPDALRFVTETTFRLAPDTYLEPDFVFYDKATGIRGLNQKTAHFVVEIADSSFAYDIGRKAALYASFGIPELWLIHAARFETRIHREPAEAGYRRAADLAAGLELAPLFAPELAVTLSGLELN
ncbi:MAG: Uma2 family endonuclease [Rhodomicrobium sp.]